MCRLTSNRKRWPRAYKLAGSIVTPGRSSPWLGVIQYLTLEAALQTLREVARATAPRSELVFEFIVPAATLSRDEGAPVCTLAARAAEVGEPWLSFFEPVDLQTHLRDIEFGHIFHFGPQQATERYLLGRTGGLRLPAYFRMIKAGVG